MQRTSFNFIGFTQPYTAFPVIEDASNNAKGFTSRILWYFPKPVFATLREPILTEDECEIVTSFKEKLGKSYHFFLYQFILSVSTIKFSDKLFLINLILTFVLNTKK